MNKSISEMAIVVMVLVALAAFAMPASASGDPGAGCPSETKYNGTITGDIYFDYDPTGLAMPTGGKTMVFNNVPDGIKLAKIYFGIWQGSPGKGGNFTIDINSSAGIYNSSVYQSCDPCPTGPCGCYPDNYQNDTTRCNSLVWAGNPAGTPPYNYPPNDVDEDIRGYITGCGVQFISFNATPYIAPGANTVTVTTSSCPTGTCYVGGWDRRVYTIALLVVYEDSSMPEITYWINEGAPYMEEGSGCDGNDDHPDASYWLNGTSMIANPTTATYEVLGWPHVFSASGDPRYTKLNDNIIGAPDYTGYAGGWDVYVRYDDVLDDSNLATSNFMEYHAPGAYYMRSHVAWLVAKGPETNIDLVPHPDLEFPRMMRPDEGYTINATIMNCGNSPAGSFNVSLLVYNETCNNALSDTVLVPPGLGGGANTTVSFENVNLPYGCYDFKVVADCYNQVAESNEGNNETVRDYQVGYYIVVDGNADFAALVTEAEAPGGLPTGSVVQAGDGTYYIQNLDIENCPSWGDKHGYGILIENTDDPFVITNCMVHNCGVDGVRLRNLVDGKVNDSTVEWNGAKGIRLMNCSYMEIDNNLAQDNEKYGIDVYMEAMPTVDCEFINITCNTLLRNQYGIEMLGDNCIMCGNIIQNSGDYGIYMFGNDSKVYNNTIENSGDYGFKLDNLSTTPCFGNYLYWNDIINSSGIGGAQAYDSGTTNTWNTPTQVSYPYGCTIRNNFTGNYWDDHTSPDANGDGIVDIPYALDGGPAQDYYPLRVEWRLCGDANRDGIIAMGDSLLIRNHLQYHPDPPFPICNTWGADAVCGGLTMGDSLAIRNHLSQGFPLGNCCTDC